MSDKKNEKTPVIIDVWNSMKFKDEDSSEPPKKKERPLPIVAELWISLEKK